MYFTQSLGELERGPYFWASSWKLLTSRIFPSSHHKIGISTACPLHSTHLSYSSAGGSKEKSLPPCSLDSLSEEMLDIWSQLWWGPGQTPGKTVQPLCPPTGEGYVWGNGKGYPLVRSGGTSCSTLGPSSPLVHDSGNGHGHPVGLW